MPQVARMIVGMSFGVGSRAIAQRDDFEDMLWIAYDRTFKAHYVEERAFAEHVDHGGES